MLITHLASPWIKNIHDTAVHNHVILAHTDKTILLGGTMSFYFVLIAQ